MTFEAPEIGEASIKRVDEDGLITEASESGTVTMRVDPCRRTVHGVVTVVPENLSVSFGGDAGLTEEWTDLCVR